MARKRAAFEKADPYTPAPILSSTKLDTPSIPTGNARHLTKVRLGRFSAEEFCRDPKRRKELGLRPLPTFESDLIEELRS
jgi:hypothetical protein